MARLRRSLNHHRGKPAERTSSGVALGFGITDSPSGHTSAQRDEGGAPQSTSKRALFTGSSVIREGVGKGKASRIVGWTEASELPGRGDLSALALDAKEQRLAAAERSRDGDKLGGYPCWVQHPARPDCPTCEEPMRFVFQLSARLVDFGDSGLGYLHQCGKHPAKLAFSWSST